MKDIFKSATAVRDIPVDEIIPNPNQPRRVFDNSKLRHLANSIKQNGLLQPIVLSPVNDEGKFTLIAGERRWRAFQINKEKTIPAIIKLDVNSHVLAIVENLEREDLHPIEECDSIAELMATKEVTQQEASNLLSIDKRRISEIVKVANLPEGIKKDALNTDISKSLLIELAKIKDKDLLKKLWSRYLKSGLTVQDIKDAKTGKKPKKQLSDEDRRNAFIRSSIIFSKALTDDNKALLQDEDRQKLTKLRDAIDQFLSS